MSRITTNPPALLAQHHLERANRELERRLERLATGSRINRAADDPSGLVTADGLRTEREGLLQAVENQQRASVMVATADAALAEIADLLTTAVSRIGLVAGEASVTSEERAAAQDELDRILDAIDRIASSTSFAGRRLLDGDAAYVTDGVDPAVFARVDVDGVALDRHDFVPVDVELLQPAATAGLHLSASGGPPAVLAGPVTLEVAGPDGTRTFTFASGTTMDTVRSAIDAQSAVTGVRAALAVENDPASGLDVESIAYGSDAEIRLRVLDGASFLAVLDRSGAAPAESAAGVDVAVAINGTAVSGRGLDVQATVEGVRLRAALTEGAATGVVPSAGFRVTGGGLRVQASARIGFVGQVGVGISDVRTDALGGTRIDGIWSTLAEARSGRAYALDGGADTVASAQRLLRAGSEAIASLRARLGSFERDRLQPGADAFAAQIERVTTGESRLRDADLAVEIAALSRAQILASAGTAALRASQASAARVLELIG